MFKKLSLIVLLATSFVAYSQTPTYYNDVNLNLTGTALRDELATKVINTHTTTLSYGWTVIQQTDLDPSDSSKVLLIYGSNDSDGNTLTDRTRSVNSNGGSSGDWNREHTYAKSLGNPSLGTSGPGADVHHLRASDVAMNGARGSLKFDSGSGVAGTSGSGWYAGDEWKGDVARMMMYMYIRYGSRCYPSGVAIGTTNSVDANMIDLFLDWNAEDPVSPYEINRNTILETAQGNRNPFIDNPAFATTIWGGTQAEDKFSGTSTEKEINLQGNGVSIADGSITTTASNNTDFGSIDTASGTIVKTFTIRNTGGATLTLSGNPSVSTGNAADFSVTSNPGSFFLAAGVSTTFDVTFDPNGDGVRTTTITILSDDADEATYTFNISGTGTSSGGSGGGSSGGNCGSETFANSNATGSYADSSFTGQDGITWSYLSSRDGNLDTNMSGIDLPALMLKRSSDDSKITSSTISGGIGDFSVKLYKGFTGRGDRQVELFINGVSKGTSTSFDDFDEHIFTVSGINISGDIIIEIRNKTRKQVIIDDISWTCYSSASAQEIDVEGNATSIPNGSTSTTTTNNTDFGSADTSSETIVKTFTINNLGGSELTLSENPTISTGDSSDFSITSNPSLTVTALGSTTFDVTFNPTADGLRTTTVVVSSDDSDEGTYTFNISGIGTTSSGALCGTELFISEYIEGSNQNKFLEIYNPTGISIDLSTYDIVTYVNGATTVSQTLALSGSIASESTFVIENTAENLSVIADLSVTAGVMDFSGDDVVALRKSGTIIDIIGQIGEDPGSSWLGACSTQGTALQRISSVGSGDTDGSDTFTTDTEWTCSTTDDVSNLGIHSLSCVTGPEINIQGNSTNIIDGTTTTTTSNNTFLGSVSVSSGTIVKIFTILNTGTATLTLSGNPSISGANSSDFSITSNPSLTVASGNSTTFQVTFDSSAEGTRDATITILSNDSDEATYTFNIQGSGTISAVACAGGSGVTIFQQDFETVPGIPILTYTGTDTTISTGNGSTPSDPKYSGGSQGLQVSNKTSTVEFATFNSSDYSNLEFSLRLASFSGTSGNGAEATDYVKVFISTVNGGSYSEELTVTGASANNARWSFTSGTGFATATYDGDNTTTTYIPSGTGARTTDGYSTLKVSSLPASTELKIKIELKNNSTGEFWVIDDAKITGDSVLLATWNGSWLGDTIANNVKVVFDSNYDMTTQAAINACECKVKAGSTVTVTADKYLKIQNNIINNGTIIVEDSGNVLQVSDISTVTGTGDYIIRRNTTSLPSRYVFTYWTSPLVSSTLAEIAPDANLYYSFNASTQSWVGANAATAITTGFGYAVQGPDAGSTYPGSYTAEFSGSEFNNGIVTISSALGESTTVGADDNWNLIGNPYPSAIDANLFMSENPDLNGTIYFWTHNTDASITVDFSQADYVSWNGTGSTANCSGCIAPTNYIASGQGFFVQALASSPIVFKNSIRVGYGNNNFYKSNSSVEEDKIWLNLSSNNSFNQILIGFLENATDGIDRLYDAEKLDGGTNANFYSLIDDRQFVIQGKSPLKELEEIPLGFNAIITGDFSISIDKFKGAIEDYEVYLKDNLLNIKHSLKAADYNFSITETGTFNNRFVLVIEKEGKALSVISEEISSKLIIENFKNNIVVKTFDKSLIKKVSVYNLLGKELLTKEASSINVQLNSNAFKTNAILIVKTLLEDGTINVNKIYKN